MDYVTFQRIRNHPEKSAALKVFLLGVLVLIIALYK